MVFIRKAGRVQGLVAVERYCNCHFEPFDVLRMNSTRNLLSASVPKIRHKAPMGYLKLDGAKAERRKNLSFRSCCACDRRELLSIEAFTFFRNP